MPRKPMLAGDPDIFTGMIKKHVHSTKQTNTLGPVWYVQADISVTFALARIQERPNDLFRVLSPNLLTEANTYNASLNIFNAAGLLCST